MTHDENEYPGYDVEAFVPDRFLDRGSHSPDPRDISFGFGRRRCPGVALANTVIFLVVARTLSAFRIDPVRDTDGNPIWPAAEFVTGFTTLVPTALSPVY